MCLTYYIYTITLILEVCYYGYVRSPKSWELYVKGLESWDCQRIRMMNLENDLSFKCSPMADCCLIPRWKHGDWEFALLLFGICFQAMCDLQVEEDFQHEWDEWKGYYCDGNTTSFLL